MQTNEQKSIRRFYILVILDHKTLCLSQHMNFVHSIHPLTFSLNALKVLTYRKSGN